MVEYTLKLSSNQAREIVKAVDLLMRLKINQPENITRAVMPESYWQDDKVNTQLFDDYIHRRDDANWHLKVAFGIIFPFVEDVKKDAEWYRLYDIYQIIRHMIHEAENPDSKGVDSYPVFRTGDEPMPEGSWRHVKE